MNKTIFMHTYEVRLQKWLHLNLKQKQLILGRDPNWITPLPATGQNRFYNFPRAPQ